MEAQRDVTYEEAKQFAEENGKNDMLLSNIILTISLMSHLSIMVLPNYTLILKITDHNILVNNFHLEKLTRTQEVNYDQKDLV